MSENNSFQYEKVKIKNGFAKAKIDEHTYLICSVYRGQYNLEYQSTATHTGFISFYLCENKARLSTINKYSAKYGVEFLNN